MQETGPREGDWKSSIVHISQINLFCASFCMTVNNTPSSRPFPFDLFVFVFAMLRQTDPRPFCGYDSACGIQKKGKGGGGEAEHLAV